MAARGYLDRPLRKTNNFSYKPGKAPRKKKVPPWDSSISNLLAHKPTKEELRRRHELHKPIPRNVASCDTNEQHPRASPSGQVIGDDKRELKTPESSKEGHFSVLRDIMNTNEKLRDALTHSDRSVSAVHDMFGDDPKKYRGFPNITCAPAQNRQRKSQEKSPEAFMKEPSLGATDLDILSNTIMDGTALNDVPDPTQEMKDQNNNVEVFEGFVTPQRRDSEKTPEEKPMCRQLSLSVVAQQPTTTSRSVEPSPLEANSSVVSSTASTLLASAPDLQGQNRPQTRMDVTRTAPTPENNRVSDTSAKTNENDHHTRSSVKPENNLPATSLKGLHDLRQMVDDLEDEVRKYEKETGREHCSHTFKTKEKGKESFGGFTVSILNAITKLVRYLRVCETQRKADLALKEEIFLGHQQQQILIDALTNDVISLQEENKKLRNELEGSKKENEQQITFLKREMYAVLKSYEYQTLSEDIGFLYDLETSNSSENSSRKKRSNVTKVIKDHGVRDEFEYLPGGPCNKPDFNEVSQRTVTQNHHQKLKDATTVQHDTETAKDETTGRQQHETSTLLQSPGEITSVKQHSEIRKTALRNLQNGRPLELETADEYQLLNSAWELDSVPSNNKRLVLPNSSLETSGNSAHLLPNVSNSMGNEPSSVKVPPSCTSPVEDGLEVRKHISFTDDVSVHVAPTYSQSQTSSVVRPIYYERHPRPGPMTTRGKVMVTLPSMWQDVETITQRSAVNESMFCAPVTSNLKPAPRQKTENGWFALSSHVDHS